MNSFNKHKIEWTSEKIGRFWDFTSKTNVPYFSKQVGANVISMVGRQLSIRGPVLDYGSGPGYLLNNLLDMGLDCHGLDISKTAVDLINTRFKKLPNFKGAVFNEKMPTPFESDYFNTIFFLETIEHLSDSRRDEILKELYRITKPGGILVVTAPNKEDLEAHETICPDCGCIFHSVQHMSSWSEKMLSAMLSRYHFAKISCTSLRLEEVLVNDKYKVKEKLLRRILSTIHLLITRTPVKTPPNVNLLYIGAKEPFE